MLFQHLQENLGRIAGIIGSLTVILGVPLFRKWALWPFIQAGRLLSSPATQEKILSEVKAVGDAVNAMKATMSLLDLRLSRGEEHRRLWFWMQSRPAMEMDGAAKVTQVSAQTLHLFKVADEDELTGLSYLRFFDPKVVSEFKRTFMEVSASQSQFGFPVELHDSRRESLGLWELTAIPIGPPINGEVTHLVNFVPRDDAAREIAGRKRWVC